MPDTPALTVRENPKAHRYEAIVDEQVAGVVMYEPLSPHVLSLNHTIVEQAHRGQGIATRLVAATLDDLRATGRKLVPICPVVKEYIARHPGYGDLVA
jgi:predicted GNAT family acetyltransferase